MTRSGDAGENRLAVIGLDAVEVDHVERMLAQGLLPTLASLRARGTWCRLQSEATWRAGRVWETFLCGNADFPSATRFDPATYESWQVGSRRKTPFYARIPGLKVLALDVPYMSLWYGVPGAQVIWGGHDAGYPRASRPAGLLTEIDAAIGVHPAFHNDFNCAWYHAPSVQTLTEALIRGSRRRTDVIRWLMERIPDWHLFMTVLSEGHSAGEMFWHGLLPPEHPLSSTPTAALASRCLREVYQELDAALGRIIALLPPDTAVLVTSIHGMEANHYDVPSMTLLPELLHRASGGSPLLRGPNLRSWRRAGCPAVIPDPCDQWHDHMKRHFGRRPGRARRLASWWKRSFRAPRPIEQLSVPILPEMQIPPELVDEPVWPLDWQTTCWYMPYWRRMRAFALPVYYDGRIRVNLKGRESAGMVDPADYDATCRWLESILHACRDLRTGAPVVDSILRWRDDDPLNPSGPDADLVVTWRPGIDGLSHPQFGDIGPFPFRRTGGHTDHGFALLAGPDIARGTLPTQEALHLTPTIMALLGVEPSQHAFFGPVRETVR